MFCFDKIICPYCHGNKVDGGVFGHKDVHFRMETYFEDEAELNDEGLTKKEVLLMQDSPAKTKLQEQINRKEPFMSKKDPQYEAFWKEFTSTTEEAYGNDRKLPIKPYELPVLNPSDAAHQRLLKVQRGTGSSREDYFLYDGDGMVSGIVDIYGKRTYRRLCPGCHNPLPTGYGKYPTKFISVIGITNSGKTVYISQLLKTISKYVNYVDMDSYFTSDHEPSFVENNPVKYDAQLPRPTMAEMLSQPMYYDLVQNIGAGKLKTDTIVIYDIAGENCRNAQAMETYGEFITKSHGIILLLDPCQLDLADTGVEKKAGELKDVLNAIHGAFRQRKSQEQIEIPVAVCISKADMVTDILPKPYSDIEAVRDAFTRRPVKKFNATSYNELQKCLCDQMTEGECEEIHNALVHSYKHFNYFAFSATGCAVEKRNGLSYPVAPPVPLRIAEPLLWMFYKFGYIGSDIPIRLPAPREGPKTVTEIQQGFLPFMKKKVVRDMTHEELDRYWYEERI